MGWISLFFEIKNKKILIVGTGEVAKRRAEKFLNEGAKVILIGNNTSNDLVEKGAIFKSKEHVTSLVEWADILVTASGDEKLNSYVSSICREKLLNRADFPEKGNLIVPTSFYIGDIQISIFTHGKSPLMARELRKKIQKSITNEEIQKIKIQDYARKILKRNIPNQKDRKKFLESIFKDEIIKEFIKNNQIKEAEKYVHSLIINEKKK